MKIAGLLLAASLVLLATSCGQFDEVATVAVVNDGQVQVVVHQCGNTCRKFHESVRVAPRGSATFNTTVGGPPEDFLVSTSNGKTLGCLTAFVKTRPADDFQVVTSVAHPCTPHQLSRGSWWDRTFG